MITVAVIWIAVGLALVVGAAVALDRVPELRPRPWLWPLLLVAGPLALAALLVAAVVAAIVIGTGV